MLIYMCTYIHNRYQKRLRIYAWINECLYTYVHIHITGFNSNCGFMQVCKTIGAPNFGFVHFDHMAGMFVCVCMCMYVCFDHMAGMYVCVFMYLYVCLYVCVFMYLYVCFYVFKFEHRQG